MDVQELREKMAKNEDMMIVDVREAGEFAAGGAIAGSTNVPMGQMFVEAAKGTLPKEKKIVTVCKSGTRCEIVARELRQKGYDIESLEGGVDAWQKDANH